MNTQYYIASDFVEQYTNIYGNVHNWRDLILDSSSIFYKCSYLIREICSIIDIRYVINNDTIIIFNNLTSIQRKDFYNELTDFGIKFNKSRYFNFDGSIITQLRIPTYNIWCIADYRFFPSRIYNLYPSQFDSLYNSLSNTNPVFGEFINVFMIDYIKFRRILKNATISYYTNNNHNLINSNSNNIQIKYQLSDIIFDIKENLTDVVYKDIMEKISKISL